MNVKPLHAVSTKSSGTMSAQADEHLHTAPFENTRDRRFFFSSAAHEEALSRLTYLAEDGNFSIGMLCGTVGSGKSLLRTMLHARLNPDHFVRVNIENSLLDFDGMLLEIISQIAGKRQSPIELPDRYSRLAELKHLLSNDVAGSNRHLVITIDEAQMLERATLDHIRALTNISAERNNLMTIILIGQPELESIISSLPQLEQRIGLRCRIDNLGIDEMSQYIEHRLKVAGWLGNMPFTRNILDELYRVCRGNPRILNRLLKLAIEHSRLNEKRLGDNAVIAVIADQITPVHEADQITGL